LLARLEGLARLPVRAQTARLAVAVAGGGEGPAIDEEPPALRLSRELPDLDPGWLAGESVGRGRADVLAIVADSPWWPAAPADGPEADALQALWRHSVAVALSCRSLARERGDPDPAGLIRAGMLHGLGRWGVAAVDPSWFARWYAEPDRDARSRLERAELGSDLRDLGRRLAERWGCEPLVVDAAWLHGEDDAHLVGAARDPARLALVREAVARAEATPWAMDAVRGRESMPSEPRLRILVAEVQSRCGAAFVAGDASPFEERAVREVARLRRRVIDLSLVNASQGRLIEALADSGPDESPENWSLRAGRTWCAEPEVNAARVVWRGPEEATTDEPVESSRRGASWSFPLEAAGEPVGEVQLWLDADVDALRARLGSTRIIDAWKAWAAHVAGRRRLEARQAAAIDGAREASRSERRRLQAAKLDALAEFAAGAGHELNNPLAVIVGRVQLLAAQSSDPDAVKSLRIILDQARRTHRILRDLMFVARPSEPRPRACRPAESVRSTLADFQDECETRGILLTGEFEGSDAPAWLDPDGLRHVVGELVRNALQAVAGPDGGSIRVHSAIRDGELRIRVADSGKGVGPAEAAHLFDPFYCGRQAGRGLGLGLSRVARIVERAGGSMNWDAPPGQGSVFEVRIPCDPPPDEPKAKIA
jgi:signal transduction histidine kinase